MKNIKDGFAFVLFSIAVKTEGKTFTLVKVAAQRKLLKRLFPTADIHSGENTGVSNYNNDSSVLFKRPSMQVCNRIARLFTLAYF